MKKLMQLMVLIALVISQAYAGNIDLNASKLQWKGSKGALGFKLGSHHGTIAIKDGNFDVKKGKLVGGDIVVDMTNFDVEDLSGSWKEKFIGHMKSGDFFKVDKYPTSKLKIKSVKGSKVVADLTINGQTHEVKFNYKKSGNAFKGKLVFDRTKYGMNYNNDSSLGDKFIHKEVELDFSIQLK